MFICLIVLAFTPTSLSYCGDMHVLNSIRYSILGNGRIHFPTIPFLKSINIGLFSITYMNRSINERILHKHQALTVEHFDSKNYVLISFDVCDDPDVLTNILLRIYFMMLGTGNTFPVYDLKIFTCVSLQFTVIIKSFFPQ